MRLQLFFLILITFALYGQTLFFDFVILDDPTLVLENKVLHQFNFSTFQKIMNPFAFRKQLGTEYLPLRDLSYVLDFYFWQKNPFGYHLTNLLLFNLSLILLFCFLKSIPLTANAAFLTTLFYTIHPIHVESVAWVAARKDMLALVFFFASLLAFPKPYLVSKHFKKRIFLSLIFFWGALLSKMTTVILPGILVLLWWKEKRRAFLLVLPHGILAILWAGLSVWIGQESGTVQWEHPLWERFFLMQAVFLGYIFQLAIPVALNCYYQPWEFSTYWPFYVVCLLVVSVLVWKLLSIREKCSQFCIAWFAITFFPVLNLIPIPFFKADRYLLLPSVAFCLAISHFFNAELTKEKTKRRTQIILITIFSCWFLLCANQIAVWKNSISLGKHSTKKAPALITPYLILGDGYLEQKKYKKAAQVYQKLVTSEPKYWKAWFNLSRVYYERKEGKQEIFALQKAYQLTQNLSDTLAQHGMTFYRFDGKMEPDLLVRVYFGSLLSLSYHRQGDFFKARTIAWEVYKKAPKWSQSAYNLGLIYARQGFEKRNAGRLTNALGYLQIVLKLEPNFAGAHAKMAEIYLHRKQVDLMQYHFQKAYSLYKKQGQLKEAEKLLEWIRNFK